MKTKRIFLPIIVFTFIAGLFSCNKDCPNETTKPVTSYLDLPSTPYEYNSGFGSNKMATLGRVLFYDKHLSVNNAISCGTCHKQSIAFSDNVPFSSGFENNLTKRNTLPIQNLGFDFTFFGGNAPRLFWDGREKFLVSMVLKPIINHVEMGMSDMNAIVNKVKTMPYYNDLFLDAFGSYDVTINNIATALSTFTASIKSNNTRFDKFMQGTTSLTGLEEQGRTLFFTKYNCNSCHQTQMFNGYETGGGFVNIGLDQQYADDGLGALTNNTSDNGKFKIPNLRNVAFTGPYMHDGRFSTLDQVLDHYSHSIANHPNLDDRLKDVNNLAIKLNITNPEKTAIVAFLNTLNDYTMMTDRKFSSPFRVQ